jgi:uncharacterized protein (TIGR00725 family)
MRKPLIGVMCPGDSAPDSAVTTAYELGKIIAQEEWVVLSGGRNKGAMNAVNKGAKEAKGLTVGISPTDNTETLSEFVDIPIVSGMGSARNNIIVLSSDVIIVIADGLGAGTASEAALALKAQKQIILLNANDITIAFFQELGKEFVMCVNTPKEAIDMVKTFLYH